MKSLQNIVLFKYYFEFKIHPRNYFAYFESVGWSVVFVARLVASLMSRSRRAKSAFISGSGSGGRSSSILNDLQFISAGADFKYCN